MTDEIKPVGDLPVNKITVEFKDNRGTSNLAKGFAGDLIQTDEGMRLHFYVGPDVDQERFVQLLDALNQFTNIIFTNTDETEAQ
jgi:hypothetical protein